MKNTKICLFIIFKLLIIGRIYSQVQDIPATVAGQGLEGIYLETYATHPQSPSNDISGGSLPENYVTYRVFVDMAPGYKLQALYGIPEHPLTIETTTTFYNNQDFGAKSGDEISETLLNNYNTAFDTWITLGAATQHHYGIPMSEDKDGSVIGYSSLLKADGLLAGRIPALRFFRLEPYFFQYKDTSIFTLADGAWLVYEGVGGITMSNKVLVMQLTTDGAITLKLNIQLISAAGGIEQYVNGNPKDLEIFNEGLTINQFRTTGNETHTFTTREQMPSPKFVKN